MQLRAAVAAVEPTAVEAAVEPAAAVGSVPAVAGDPGPAAQQGVEPKPDPMATRLGALKADLSALAAVQQAGM